PGAAQGGDGDRWLQQPADAQGGRADRERSAARREGRRRAGGAPQDRRERDRGEAAQPVAVHAGSIIAAAGRRAARISSSFEETLSYRLISTISLSRDHRAP